MKNTVQKEGIVGLYKGAPIAMVGILTYKGFGFTIYEELYKANSRLNLSNITLNFSSGAIAGFCGQTSKSPLFYILT